jgi:hypothetical protein
MAAEPPNSPWSVKRRMRERMRLLVMRDRLAAETRALEPAVSGLGEQEFRIAFEDAGRRWQELTRAWDDLDADRPYPDGDACVVREDEPLFGEENPPHQDELLYHYTRVSTLPRIRKRRSLRFQPLRAMNDPHEALETHAFMTGLIGPGGAPLVMSSDEVKAFHSIDWVAELNAARANVKIGAFSMDAHPDLTDIDPDAAGDLAPRRFWATRGFAHPRM